MQIASGFIVSVASILDEIYISIKIFMMKVWHFPKLIMTNEISAKKII